MDELYQLDEELEAQTRLFRTQHRYLLIDLAEFDDEELRRRASDAFRHLVLFALREARSTQILQKLRALADTIEALASAPEAGEHFWIITCYISSVSSDPTVTPQAVNEHLSNAGPGSRAIPGSNFERFMNEVLEEGRQEGREEGRKYLVEILVTMVSERFGTVASDHEARIQSADLEQLQKWLRKLGKSESLDELLEF